MILEKENEVKNIVMEFKNNFFKMNGRDPLDFEMMDNLQEKVDINQIDVLKQICGSETL